MKYPGAGAVRSLPFAYSLVLIILLITIPMIGFIAWMDYDLVSREFSESTTLLQNQTEQSIEHSMVLVDNGLKLFDNTYNEKMRSAMIPFLEAYEQSGGSPDRIDLAALKGELNGEYDLYIINESGVIVYTTSEPDIGHDFRQWPYFHEYITNLRLGSNFSADRVVYQLSTGEVKKFAYMPTPDHRYLLELGLAGTALGGLQKNRIYQETAAELIELNPYLENVRIFNSMKVLVTDNSLPDGETSRQAIIDQVYEQKAGYEFTDEDAGKQFRYLYVNLTDPDYASDLSQVVELTYNIRLVDSRLQSTLISHILIALSAIFFIGCITIVAARHVTRPIREIVEDVDIIAHGDLDHPIRATRSTEFASLERSINAMVGALKANILRIRQSEEKIRHYSEHLEEQVDERTFDLKKSTEMANLYLDILSHDISNVINTTNLYSDLLRTSVIGEEAETHAENLGKSLQKSIQILRNVKTIRRAQEHQQPLRNIALDPVIRAEIDHYSGVTIEYSGTEAHVMADELLPEVFNNLLGNSARILGTSGQIWITVDDAAPDYVEVSVEDNGPGMPDSVKQEVFAGLAETKGRRGGKGLGLYICRMLVERYGGSIRADDRIPGQPEKGVAIRFLLKKPDSS